MRAREKMIATSHASAAAPVSFEDTLFQVSMKTQQRHAQARSLERLPTSSVSRGIDQDLPHSTTTTAESDDDVPEGIPMKFKNASTIAENGDDRGKRRGGAAKSGAHESDSEDLQTPVQAIASAKLQHNYSVKAENTTLISENATLKAESPDVDSGICVWCLEQHSQVAIVPCGHKCLCAQCKSKVSVCPICRGPVTSTLRIFQS
jgi:hypothetical protein